jgi:hypothetical protein
MEGARGRVEFVLADRDSQGISSAFTKPKEEKRQPDWTWKIVRREPRTIAYDEFTEDNFFSALLEIVNV